jgi:hypothetical protein
VLRTTGRSCHVLRSELNRRRVPSQMRQCQKTYCDRFHRRGWNGVSALGVHASAFSARLAICWPFRT